MNKQQKQQFIANQSKRYREPPFNLDSVSAHVEACKDLWRFQDRVKSKYIQRALVGEDRPHEF